MVSQKSRSFVTRLCFTEKNGSQGAALGQHKTVRPNMSSRQPLRALKRYLFNGVHQGNSVEAPRNSRYILAQGIWPPTLKGGAELQKEEAFS